MPKRYFLHGDHNPDSGLYYCRGCDAFMPYEHFVGADSIHGDHRYLQRTIREFEVLKKKGYYRPEKVHNIG